MPTFQYYCSNKRCQHPVKDWSTEFCHQCDKILKKSQETRKMTDEKCLKDVRERYEKYRQQKIMTKYFCL